MKYLITCSLALSLLASCTVIQEQYYEPEYYNPPPPPPARVEVYPNHNMHHNFHESDNYRPAPRAQINHGHVNSNQTAAVVVRPNRPQNQGQVHTSHNAGAVQAHNTQPKVAVHPQPAKPQAKVQKKVQIIDKKVARRPNPAALPPEAQVETQVTEHGHN